MKHKTNFSSNQTALTTTILASGRKKPKKIATILLTTLLYQLVFPTLTYAISGGPSTPDFSSFEPVATTNMVNDFSGQFVYNVPVLEVPGAAGGGYALSLSYHSGDGPESEASWVGHGWSLNPGAISRAKRGLPDDYLGKNVNYYNKMPKNWTISATGVGTMEMFSSFISFGIYNTVRYNNYKGFSFTKQFGLQALRGLFSLGYHINGGEGTFSVAVNPAALLSYASDGVKKASMSSGSSSSRQTKTMAVTGVGQSMRQAVSSVAGGATSAYISYLLTDATSPYNITPYEGKTIAGAANWTGDIPPAPIGFSAGGNLSYTSQENVPVQSLEAFGYMYSGQAYDNDSPNTQHAKHVAMMDYTVERPSTFNQRDKFLPVPTSTPDAFFVSGEGVGGGFRMYNERIGAFSPNFAESKTKSRFFGLDIHTGWNNGAGGEFLIDGEHTLTVKSDKLPIYDEWNHNNRWFVPQNYWGVDQEIDEGTFFRFNNDLGGKMVYGSNYEMTDSRSGRSSYIGYHTNSEIQELVGGYQFKAYDRDPKVNLQAGRMSGGTAIGDPQLNDLIGEVAVYNEDGNSYVYGLPVYNAQEKNISSGISTVSSGNNYWVQGDISNNTKKVGEEYTTPYVSTYLLTQITTPDYVDLNLNGPDDNDFGGYTKFIYRHPSGYESDNKYHAGKMYKWRAPYTGLYFNPMRLSDNLDNMGSYQSGYREMYYLDTIETKTHFAVFITGNDREDGHGANTSDESAASGSVGSNYTEYLKEIKLYSKPLDGQQPKLLKTVFFQYDYSAWPNVPNNTSGGGKLTLKKVWFEYNGVFNAQITPYEFEYEYPTSNDVGYPSRYHYILDEMNSGLNQSPSYTQYIDCWGNYQDDGNNRRNKLLPSPTQNPASSFDAAAWNLKRIILPSGGEIHIQYEQHSYSHVQNRRPMALVPLIGSPGDLAFSDSFELDVSTLGITSTSDKDRLVSLINATLGGQMIYYKFLYNLLGTGAVSLGDCNADYIDGYGEFKGAWRDGTKVKIRIGSPPPRQTCLDYVQYEVGGKLLDGNCAPTATEQMNDWGTDSNKLRSIAKTFVKAVEHAIGPTKWLNACKEINPSQSYFKIPIWRKKGGGVRVKRLLMYNNGVDAGSKSLYGSEYLYENESTKESFGVATNEPFENGQENPLVTYMDARTPQSKWDRLFQGRDREQFEGPLSYSALPAPSIGYSRIIKKNIHQDAITTTGYTVIDYYTAKDYPSDGWSGGALGAYVSPVDIKSTGPHISIGLFAYSVSSDITAKQSYTFVQNQMHGQLKSITDYPGTYNSGTFYSISAPPSPIEQVSYEYFSPGALIPMYNFKSYSTYLDKPGMEMDITVAQHKVVDEGSETRFTGDLTFAVVGPITIPYPIGWPITSGSKTTMKNTTEKTVIHYPAIMKRSSIMRDGFVQHTDYVGFDPSTCKPVMTRTYDAYNQYQTVNGLSHNGIYTQYNIPASSIYDDMGQKAYNERYVYRSSISSDPFSVTANGSEYDVTEINKKWRFCKGDQIAILGGPGIGIAFVTEINGVDVKVVPDARYNTSLPTGASFFRAEVLRSGKTNQLSASMGGYTEYGLNPGLKSVDQLLKDMTQAVVKLRDSTCTTCTETIILNEYATNLLYGDLWDCNEYNYINHRVGFIKIEKTPGPTYKIYFLKHDGITPAWPMGPIFPITDDLTSTVLGLPQNVTDPWGFSIDYTNHVSTNNWMAMYGPTDTTYLFGTFCPLETVGVLKASSTTYADDWPYDPNIFNIPSGLNLYETGQKGKWRPHQTYVYNDVVIGGSRPLAGERVYKSAGISNKFVLTRWDKVFKHRPELWIKTSEILKYSPNGNAIEEVDANSVYSTAKYGYKSMLPYLISENAPYNSVYFESFENAYNFILEDNIPMNGNGRINEGHTGVYSMGVATANPLNFNQVYDQDGKGHLIRFWLKGSATSSQLDVHVTSAAGAAVVPATYVTTTGAWSLYEARYSSGVPNSYTDYSLVPSNAGNWVQMDDVRLQPLESTMTAYVYDLHTLKLSAVLNDQHHATYYQYNGEGKLVRKILETEMGPRTVEEAQYHTPKRVNIQDLNYQPTGN